MCEQTGCNSISEGPLEKPFYEWETGRKKNPAKITAEVEASFVCPRPAETENISECGRGGHLGSVWPSAFSPNASSLLPQDRWPGATMANCPKEQYWDSLTKTCVSCISCSQRSQRSCTDFCSEFRSLSHFLTCPRTPLAHLQPGGGQGWRDEMCRVVSFHSAFQLFVHYPGKLPTPLPESIS